MRETTRFFSALASEDRLRILNLLLSEKDGVCVCELVDALKLPQYEVSRQLALLRGCGLVTGEKKGTWVYYRVPQRLPSLEGATIKALRAQLDGEISRDDRERLKQRLLLRATGVCTIGYPVDAAYREFIPIEEVAGHG